MSDNSVLHAFVQEKFRRVFGEPHRAQGRDLHWALRPHAYVAPINILLDGGAEHPIVWIFDPHDPKDGVSNIPMRHEAEVDPIIRSIERRVMDAGRPGGS